MVALNDKIHTVRDDSGRDIDLNMIENEPSIIQRHAVAADGVAASHADISDTLKNADRAHAASAQAPDLPELPRRTAAPMNPLNEWSISLCKMHAQEASFRAREASRELEEAEQYAGEAFLRYQHAQKAALRAKVHQYEEAEQCAGEAFLRYQHAQTAALRAKDEKITVTRQTTDALQELERAYRSLQPYPIAADTAPMGIGEIGQPNSASRACSTTTADMPSTSD